MYNFFKYYKGTIASIIALIVTFLFQEWLINDNVVALINGLSVIVFGVVNATKHIQNK